ncbi:tetratricopeptide repeat-containing glycosyltransferase family 2 protein [Paenibacillus algorifonticola]|uniref:tetratricopeptide repeat-containing glycosyltransferase family 2 protein n=1 Tax=Paenibacillus algorifonticola TaxID=684063 RepID=UPI003D2D3890
MVSLIAISLCMIVKNEEKTLARCLSSIAPAVDEIIIVDTGSTDATREIAADFNARVESFTWADDFAAARNYAFSLATKPYIMWLDADDVLEVSELHKLKALKHQLGDTVDSVSMDYHLSFDEFGNVVNKLRRNRIVKRERSFQWIGAVHEYLEVYGNIVHCDVAVTHKSLGQDSDRNLTMYENRLRRGEIFTPRDLFYYANELKDNGRYDSAIRYYDKFLATGKGWIEDNILACGRLADCYHELNEPRNMMDSVLRSFYYDKPRAEFCCRLGHYFLQRDELQMAVYWYKQALHVEHTDTTDWGFANITCSTWLPQLQLCVCYDRLGDFEAAYMHNEQAAKYRPEDERMIANRVYLSQRLCKTDEGGVVLV